ncbi:MULTISPECIES: hypothetical protein [Streptomyces]|jgi:hypothetical protein|uniref:Uncharacterized protein n=2 Tax=Streptomyces TaxID=1883 RepID=A0ABW9IJA9_STRGJ|nr:MULTISPECIES: hypothetical protein [Streptomyces]MDX3568333.1 hypothetical protein [Streptomyces sp. ID05-47C]QEU68854.1 hypothetical protein CP966_28970 [Streptomyces galilaeus]GGW24898.1 hypothetical protein GCM10010350_04250 [Streptomyces galilaeus]
MSRITPLLQGDAAAAEFADDLVITEFGHGPGEHVDSAMCICWAPLSGTPSATVGGPTSR